MSPEENSCQENGAEIQVKAKMREWYSHMTEQVFNNPLAAKNIKVNKNIPAWRKCVVKGDTHTRLAIIFIKFIPLTCLISLYILPVVCEKFCGNAQDCVVHSGWVIEGSPREIITRECMSYIPCLPKCAPWNTSVMRCNHCQCSWMVIQTDPWTNKFQKCWV